MIVKDYPDFAPTVGYLTDKIRTQYIDSAIEQKLLPASAHRMAPVLSLIASNDPSKPIQFWQLYSVLGSQRIQAIARRFYKHVFADEYWFTSVFARISSEERHTLTQSSMWIDVMGGGQQYHGGEFRLNFHHTHNAFELMNDRGAKRWVELMAKTLNEPGIDFTDDVRVRPAINTFLNFFMGKYAIDFKFENCAAFGQTNPALKKRINFLNLSSDDIEALSEDELKDEFIARGIDTDLYNSKQALVNKALSL
jgi:truncated hemoglobin YjbI